MPLVLFEWKLLTIKAKKSPSSLRVLEVAMKKLSFFFL
jgi:hypothetical protein